jgi:hypothetical protein
VVQPLPLFHRVLNHFLTFSLLAVAVLVAVLVWVVVMVTAVVVLEALLQQLWLYLLEHIKRL